MWDMGKYGLLIGAFVFQVGFIVLLFFQRSVSWYFLFFYVLFTAGLIGMLIMERRKEKKEEEQHDYRDY